MATLTSPAGTFWDRSPAQSIAQTAAVGPYALTLNHSLGATPDFIVVNVLSIGINTGSAEASGLGFGALRGNASINTIQVLAISAAIGTIPVSSYEVYSAVIHSFIR